MYPRFCIQDLYPIPKIRLILFQKYSMSLLSFFIFSVINIETVERSWGMEDSHLRSRLLLFKAICSSRCFLRASASISCFRRFSFSYKDTHWHVKFQNILKTRKKYQILKNTRRGLKKHVLHLNLSLYLYIVTTFIAISNIGWKN